MRLERIAIGARAALSALTALTALTAAGGAWAQAPRGVSADKVVFGTQLDVSGVLAASGNAIANGMRMRFEEANAGGGVHGRRLELIVEDSGYQVPRAVQAVNKLINRDKVFAIIGSTGTGLNNATIPDQMAAGVPNLFPGASARSMYEPFHRLKFSSMVPYIDQTRATVKYLTDKQRGVKLCVMYLKNDYGEEILQGVNEQMAALGRSVTLAMSHRPTDVDFSASVLKLRDAGCTAVVLGTLVRDSAAIAAAVKNAGWDVPLVAGFPAQSNVVAELPGGAGEGFMAMSQIVTSYPDDANPRAAEWTRRFIQKYNAFPTIGGQLGYGWADMAVKALQAAGPELTMDKFIAGLEGLKNHQDLFGSAPVSFARDKRIGTLATYLVQVKNGRWVRITDELTY